MRFFEQSKKLIPEFLLPQGNSSYLKPISDFQGQELISINPHFLFSKELQSHLQGKKLLLDEIPFPIELIHQHYEQGYIQYHHGVTNQGQLTCQRCGNEESLFFASFHCARCHQECTYCRKCITMGRVSQCTPLLTWEGPSIEVPTPEQVLFWSGSLSEAQKTASDEVVRAVNNHDQLLVWAVCTTGNECIR